MILPLTAVLSSEISDPSGPIGKLCTWLQALPYHNVPTVIQTRAKYLILDGIGCALYLPWSETAAKAIFCMESPGNCSVFG